MNDKDKQVMALLNGECIDITRHVVSANWYRMNIDMYHKGDEPIEIVQCTYDPELYAIPNYMTKAEYMAKTAEQIAEEWEI